jgi:hypothetical protein
MQVMNQLIEREDRREDIYDCITHGAGHACSECRYEVHALSVNT